MTLTDSLVAETGTAGSAASAGAPAGHPDAAAPQAQVVARPVMAAEAAVVGRLFVGTSLLAGLGTAVIGVLVALERLEPAEPSDVFGGLNSYFQMWTLYRVSFLLLVVMPLLLGVAMAVVPSQIGAANLALPRAALAAFWSWLIGAVIMVSSVLAGGGWGALDGVTARESDAIALTLLGTAMVIVSLLAGAIAVATTIVSSRPAGMSLLTVPAFAWSMLVACAVWLLTLPAAIANIVLAYADLRGRPAVAYGQAEGPDIWLQLDWLTEQPAVYAFAIPVLGVAIDAVRRAAGSVPVRPEAVLVVVGLFGLLSVGGWNQDYFTAPDDHRDGLLYIAFGLAAVVPVAAALGVAAGSVAQGSRPARALASPRFVAAMVALLLLAGAVLIGALRVIEPLDLLESTASSAVFHAVTIAGLAAGAAALWHWAPQLLSRGRSNAAGRAIAVLLLAGGVLLAVPALISGLQDTADMPARGLEAGDAAGGLDASALAGSALVALAMLSALPAAVSALRAAASATPPPVAIEGDGLPAGDGGPATAGASL